MHLISPRAIAVEIGGHPKEEHFNLNIGEHTVNNKSYTREKFSGFLMNCNKFSLSINVQSLQFPYR